MTSIAILAIAGIGLGMLGGRIHVKRGVTAVIGAFILFGAPSIAFGIMSSAMTMGGVIQHEQFASVAAPMPIQLPPAPPAVSTSNGDPYAGAAVPRPRVPTEDLY